MDFLNDTLGIFIDPEQRVFWPGLLVAGVLAALAGGQLRRFLDPKLWTHPSAVLDYALLVANAAIRGLVIAPLGLSAFALAVGVVDSLDRAFGIPTAPSLSTASITALYTVALFVCWDLSRYLVHRLLHQVPALWAIHKVHHSAQVMTPLTLFRVHPIERLLLGVRGILVTGIVTGLFFYVFRARAIQYELLGVNVLGIAFNLLGSNLRHSHVWLTYGRYVEHLFISPAQHQIHHGTEMHEQMSNYGTWLALWDWLGGSLRLANDDTRPAGFGLARVDANHDPHGLVSALLGPFGFRPGPGNHSSPSSESSSSESSSSESSSSESSSSSSGGGTLALSSPAFGSDSRSASIHSKL